MNTWIHVVMRNERTILLLITAEMGGIGEKRKARESRCHRLSIARKVIDNADLRMEKCGEEVALLLPLAKFNEF